MATREEVKEHLKNVLEKLDSMADEDGIADGFVIDALIIGSEERGYEPNMGLLFYDLSEMGHARLALDFDDWYSVQTEYKLA